MSTNMSNRRTRFPGWEKDAGKTADYTSAAHPSIPVCAGPHRGDPNISVHLPMTGRDQSPWTEYKRNLRTEQAGEVIIAYDRKMKEFAIKEVKGCRRDWLLKLKAISHTNIVRFVAGFFYKGSIYLVCDLMTTSLADVLSVLKLPFNEVAIVCKDVINGLCYLHKDLMVSHGAISGENILLSKAGDVKLGAFSLLVHQRRIMNISPLLANVGECLLAQSKEQNIQKDVQSLGLLLVEMLEPDSVFLKPPPSTLQRPDCVEPSAVDFLARTWSDSSDQLRQVCCSDSYMLHRAYSLQHGFLERSRGSRYLKPFISDAERFMPPLVEKLDVN
jgi:serine/threonine protein kinase